MQLTFSATFCLLCGVQEAHAQRKKGYAELRRREERVKQLKIIAEKLQMKRHLSAVSETGDRVNRSDSLRYV